MTWSDEALDEEVTERHLDALVGAADSRLVDTPTWHQVLTPSFSRGGLNGVGRCRVKPVELEARVDETLAEYRAASLTFRWTVTRRCTPGLVELLRARGLEERPVVPLYREPTLTPLAHVGVTVQAVDAGNVSTFSGVMAEGWGMPVAPFLSYDARLLGYADRQRPFLAFVDGVPAGAGGLAIVARSVALVGAVVLPRFRGRGVYRALLDARVALARSLGRPLVTCLARPDTSAPILERLGFSRCALVPVFHGAPAR